MPARTQPRLLTRLAKAALTLVSVAIIVLALPVVLAIVIGVPIPHPFTTHQVFGERGVFDLIVIVVWLLWAANVVLLVRATVALLRHHDVSTAAPGYIKLLAVRLAGACLVISALWGGAAAGASTPTGRAHSAPAVTAPAPAHLIGPPAPTTVPAPTPAATPAPAPAPVPAATTPSTVTVQEGQSLWTIAEQVYGTGTDWQLLANANLGHTMNDGLVFTDPNLIYPGWELTTPPLTAATPAPTSAVAPAPAPAAPVAPPAPTAASSPTAVVGPPAPAPRLVPAAPKEAMHHVTATPPAHAAASTKVTVPTTEAAKPVPTAPPAAVTKATVPASVMAGAAAAERQVARKHHDASTDPRVAKQRGQGHDLLLPELAMLGLGALAASVLARRVRWNRRWARLGRRPGQTTPPLTDDAEEASADLVPFEPVPALSMVELGLCHLTHAIGEDQDEAPPVRLVRVGPDGLALVLAEQTERAPGHFSLAADGYAWVLTADQDYAALPGAHDGEPWLPALVPVGESSEGTYLVPVEPGAVVVLSGPRARQVEAAMRVVASAWEWAGSGLTVTTEPEQAAEEAAYIGDPSETIERVRVLFFGDPSLLDPQTAERVGVVTRCEAQPSDAWVECADDASRLEPFGLDLAPAALDEAQETAVDELLANSAAEPAEPDIPVDVEAVVAAAGGLVCPPPGPIDVRVLVPLPRVDGAEGVVPGIRADRAVELMAYLALKGGPVPTFEACGEALATKKGEGSRQTLRLVATDLRKWVGAEHLPMATKGGYATGDEVTTDLGRLQAAVNIALAANDPDDVVAVLRAALELIEGRPASQTKMGWGWWDVYEAAAANAAADAASMLAPILAERGRARGARWAIDQARMLALAEWNEELYRLAIRCAAKTGNAAWVDREMRACEAMIEELAPGATPSPETYEAYREAMALFGVPA